jgi:hypothetical protein
MMAPLLMPPNLRARTITPGDAAEAVLLEIATMPLPTPGPDLMPPLDLTTTLLPIDLLPIRTDLMMTDANPRILRVRLRTLEPIGAVLTAPLKTDKEATPDSPALPTPGET